jgi:hypothetical protein
MGFDAPPPKPAQPEPEHPQPVQPEPVLPEVGRAGSAPPPGSREPRLLRRFGERVRGVEPRFDARALNEIGFQPAGTVDEASESFDARMVAVREVLVESTSDGPVQAEAEALLLDRLRASLDALLADLAEGEVGVVENQPGVDWPKTRERRKDVIVDGENRFHFHWRVDPPLRISIYRGREG